MDNLKANYRKKMKASLNRYPLDNFSKDCKQIAERLYTMEEWKSANTIGLTISRGKEIDTTPIIEKAWEQGKMVAVPKCIPETRQMDFRSIERFEQLEVVYYGLKEPIENMTTFVGANEIELLIVPGLLYDERGYRIGFGGGYFDRYLTKYNEAKLSLSLEIQLIDHVPNEPFDIAVDKVITEKRIIKTNG